MDKIFKTSSGIVELIDGNWTIVPNGNDDDISWQNFTDRFPYDFAVIRHESKYGLFYVSDMAPTYLGNTNPPLISFDKDTPFPYDEILIKGSELHEIMIIGYRIGGQWGIDNLFFDRNSGTICRCVLASCKFLSLHDAEESCLSWKYPFEHLDVK